MAIRKKIALLKEKNLMQSSPDSLIIAIRISPIFLNTFDENEESYKITICRDFSFRKVDEGPVIRIFPSYCAKLIDMVLNVDKRMNASEPSGIDRYKSGEIDISLRSTCTAKNGTSRVFLTSARDRYSCGAERLVTKVLEVYTDPTKEDDPRLQSISARASHTLNIDDGGHVDVRGMAQIYNIHGNFIPESVKPICSEIVMSKIRNSIDTFKMEDMDDYSDKGHTTMAYEMLSKYKQLYRYTTGKTVNLPVGVFLIPDRYNLTKIAAICHEMLSIRNNKKNTLFNTHANMILIPYGDMSDYIDKEEW